MADARVEKLVELTPLRVMVDCENLKDERGDYVVMTASLLDANGIEWFRYRFASITGHMHIWTPEEKITVAGPITRGPRSTCADIQVVTIDRNSRDVHLWIFPREKAT